MLVVRVVEGNIVILSSYMCNSTGMLRPIITSNLFKWFLSDFLNLPKSRYILSNPRLGLLLTQTDRQTECLLTSRHWIHYIHEHIV